MKILYIVHQFFPEHYTGTEKVVLNIARMAQKFGHKVKVVAYSGYENSSYKQKKGNILLQEFLYDGLPVLAIKQKRPSIDINIALESTGFSEITVDLIKQEKPDIIHIGHAMRMGGLVEQIKSLNVPYIMTLTDCFMLCPKHNLITSLDTLCMGPNEGATCRKFCPEFSTTFISNRLAQAKDVLANAKSLTASSEFTANIFRNEFPDIVIRSVDHGIQYRSLKKKRQTYAKGDRIVFCYLGSHVYHKGIHTLINAFRNVSADNAYLKLYGSGEEESYAKSLQALAGDDQRIEFCGVFPEGQLGFILQEVDVVVIPSMWYESYCLVLHEAFACNIPVIASDIGVLAEKIQSGENGFQFRMGDAQHLRERLQMIADNPTTLNRLKQNINKMPIRAVEQEAFEYAQIYAQISGKSQYRFHNVSSATY